MHSAECADCSTPLSPPLCFFCVIGLCRWRIKLVWCGWLMVYQHHFIMCEFRLCYFYLFVFTVRYLMASTYEKKKKRYVGCLMYLYPLEFVDMLDIEWCHIQYPLQGHICNFSVLRLYVWNDSQLLASQIPAQCLKFYML